MVLAMALGVAVMGFATGAGASIFPDTTLITPLGGGIFNWAYPLSVGPDQFIPKTNGSQPCTTLGTSGASTQCAFFTLFDLFGYVSGSASFTSSIPGLTGTISTPLTGPVAFLQSPTDNPSVENLDVAFANSTSLTFTSPTAGSTFGITGAPLGTLSFNSTFGRALVGEYDAQADGTTVTFASGNSAQVQLPSPPAVPEPASAALLGPILILMAMRRHRCSGMRGAPSEIRTRVTGLKGRCPRPG
jgi:hypothetical protein